LSDINEFIEQNPDKAQAVAVVLALTQGPKGVIQAVAMSAAEQTPLGQELMARLQGMQEYVGQKIAEHMEGQGLKKDDSFDQYLMGGGSLVASIIGTGISAVKGGKAGADGPSREVKTGAERGNGGAKGAGEVASIGGKTCVYNCVVDGVTRYVGITDDIVKRGQAHLREKGITIDRIEGLQNLSRADARAVEQTLINYHGLGKDGGTLVNKINSISSVKNPTKYEQGLIRGAELLKKAGYEGF
ncbi:hypothetical protein, partial [Pseudomonas urmiensis]|uniref:hypothetical protein n=1 Tax=Pseudomonas urmiensis TaxID=2745493 RepID=UPI003CB0D6C5